MFAEIIMDSHDIARWADDHRSQSLPTSIFPAKDLEIIDRQDNVFKRTSAFLRSSKFECIVLQHIPSRPGWCYSFSLPVLMLSHCQQITEVHQNKLFDMSDGLFGPFTDVKLLPHETCQAYGAGGTSKLSRSCHMQDPALWQWSSNLL